MIELKDASIRRDGRVLFKDVNLQIHPGWKIGLTGNNGTGKSSFFATLLNQKAKANWHSIQAVYRFQAVGKSVIWRKRLKALTSRQ